MILKMKRSYLHTSREGILMSEILMEFKKGFLAVWFIINIFHDIRDRTM